MFRKSRNKIILSIMASVTALFVLTLALILLASWRELRQNDAEMLSSYLQNYTLGKQSVPGKPGGAFMDGRHTGKDSRGFVLSTFYAVVIADDGTSLVVDDGGKDVYSEEELKELAARVLAGGKTDGRADTLTYRVSRTDGGYLVVFLDNTLTDSSMNMLVRNYLIVGGAAIAVFFFLSLWLSKRIIRPLEESDRRQKQFISDASHELKTPVAVIAANAELLSRELGQNEWLSGILYENDRMGELVRQLLELSHAENVDTVMECVALSPIVQGEALAFDSLAFDRGKVIESEVEEGLCVMGNASQLTQLVSILLDNAIRHSTQSRIDLTLKRQAHTAVLSVTNAADDIPPEQLAHLFDRFYRVDEARSGDERHYGLGLSIARAVAQTHHGEIHAASRGGSVTFTVSLPLKTE